MTEKENILARIREALRNPAPKPGHASHQVTSHSLSAPGRLLKNPPDEDTGPTTNPELGANSVRRVPPSDASTLFQQPARVGSQPEQASSAARWLPHVGPTAAEQLSLF